MPPPDVMPLSRRRRKWVSRDVSHFQQVEQVGEGTYGQVWQAKDKYTNEVVALKRVRMDNEREGFPLTAIREIKLLKTLHHENIVNLKEIVTGKGSSNGDSRDPNKPKGSIYMVFEYMDHDLTGLMDTPSIRFTESQVKCYMIQLLNGLEYCHGEAVLHRDIKGSNLLIDNNGNLKIADFGLARTFGESGRKYTNRVITLWYRPPELLLGSTLYGPSVDMWSVGCLLAELLTRKPLFPGKDEAEQLDLIFHVIGSPNDKVWPNWRDLPQADMVSDSRIYPPQLERHYKKLATYHSAPYSTAIADLLRKMLTLDPEKRITATEALAHRWFQEEPYACRKEDLPKHKESTHEFQAKRRRQASNLNRGTAHGRDGHRRDGHAREGHGTDGHARDGHARDGYGRDGPGRSGPGRDGPGRDGPGRDGPGRAEPGRAEPGRAEPGRDGYRRDSYVRDGHERDGRGRDGYGRDGYNRDDYNRDGYNRDSYNRDSYGRDGREREGYVRDGRERDGYGRNDQGRDRRGNDGRRERYSRDGRSREGVHSSRRHRD